MDQIGINHYSSIQRKCDRRKRVDIPRPPRDFTPVQIDNLSFSTDKHFINNFQYYNLKKEIIYTLNNGDILPCYGNSCGVICVMDIPLLDIRYLNSLAYSLIQMANITNGFVHYMRMHPDDDAATTSEFFPMDQKSKIFNSLGQPILRTNMIKTFRGHVAVGIRGLRLLDKFNISIDAFIYQIKIMEEDDVILFHSHECMFP